LNIDVIVATRGRSKEVQALLDKLELQTRIPDNVIIVGTEPADLPSMSVARGGLKVHGLISPRAGLTSQRNHAVKAARSFCDPAAWSTKIVVFFDDDFRPATHWLQRCEALFATKSDVLAITGTVILDGVTGGAGIAENRASQALDAHADDKQALLRRWKIGLYGCNMAVRATVFDRCAFDENLPLYGWLEDTDFSGQIQKFSDVYRASNLIGVHLGSQSGRVSGYKYGYSQISNPLFLWRKGSIAPGRCIHFCTRALASNALRSLREHPKIDYRGRLAGNLRALKDMITGSMHPTNVLSARG
jgi:glycosyltransferase involved in cell wall biosynthesis